MPFSEQELIQLIKSKGGTDQQIQQAQAMRQTNGIVPQQKQGPQSINDMLRGINPVLGDAVGKMAGAMTQMGGATPPTDYSKIFATEQAKAQFRDKDYVVSYDENGQPVFNQAPGNVKNAPFYSTPQGGQYYGEKTRQAGSQADQANAETGLMNQVMPAVQEAMAGNKGQLPPGASVSAGPVTFQPNPRLTDTEQAAVAGSQALEPVVQKILSEIQGGIFGQGDDVERTARQGIVDSGNSMLSSQDTKLQSFQSDINNLKRLIPFTDGGKQLTPFEAKRVFALLNTTGKNDQQIYKDIQAAVSIVMAKGGLAIGGRNAAIQGISQPTQQQKFKSPSEMTDEEIQAELNGMGA